MQEKTGKKEKPDMLFPALIGCVLAVVLAVFAGVMIDGGWDRMQAKRVFGDASLTPSEAAPVVKAPFTVYALANRGGWRYGELVQDTSLFERPDITKSVTKSRTCLFLWPDVSDVRRSGEVWGVASGAGYRKYRDAFFCPVYMTVVDREDGIRYKDVYVGLAPLDPDDIRKTATLLVFDTGNYSKINLAWWIDARLEKSGQP